MEPAVAAKLSQKAFSPPLFYFESPAFYDLFSTVIADIMLP